MFDKFIIERYCLSILQNIWYYIKNTEFIITQSIKSVAFNKFNYMFDKFSPCSRINHQWAQFSSQRIILTSDSNSNFNSITFQRSDFFVKLIVQIGPGIMRFDHKIITVQNSKAINYMCANGWINVLRTVFSNARPIPRPISEIWKFSRIGSE